MKTPLGIVITQQLPHHDEALRELNENAFGPGRFARTAYRIREHALYDPSLNLCAFDGNKLIGALELTAVSIGGAAGALLLGPLVIEDTHKNQGIGLRLLQEAAGNSYAAGYKLIILVGDLPYYARAGFAPVPHGRIELPGPVDVDRLLSLDLVPDALNGFKGMVRGQGRSMQPAKPTGPRDTTS